MTFMSSSSGQQPCAGGDCWGCQMSTLLWRCAAWLHSHPLLMGSVLLRGAQPG